MPSVDKLDVIFGWDLSSYFKDLKIMLRFMDDWDKGIGGVYICNVFDWDEDYPQGVYRMS